MSKTERATPLAQPTEPRTLSAKPEAVVTIRIDCRHCFWVSSLVTAHGFRIVSR